MAFKCGWSYLLTSPGIPSSKYPPHEYRRLCSAGGPAAANPQTEDGGWRGIRWGLDGKEILRRFCDVSLALLKGYHRIYICWKLAQALGSRASAIEKTQLSWKLWSHSCHAVFVVFGTLLWYSLWWSHAERDFTSGAQLVQRGRLWSLQECTKIYLPMVWWCWW